MIDFTEKKTYLHIHIHVVRITVTFFFFNLSHFTSHSRVTNDKSLFISVRLLKICYWEERVRILLVSLSWPNFLLSGAKTIGFCQCIFCLVCIFSTFLKYVELQKQTKLKFVNLLNKPTKKLLGQLPRHS